MVGEHAWSEIGTNLMLNSVGTVLARPAVSLQHVCVEKRGEKMLGQVTKDWSPQGSPETA